MHDDIAISVNNVNKTFKLPHEKTSSIKNAVINFYKRNKTFDEQQALKSISFEVKKGEFFGVVGRNGSGKSTLLKILAGIYSPDAGSVEIKGRLTPFIELGVGFSPELTGRENIYLNGALLGFSRKKMKSMYADIVSFAELEEFMDQKLKNYSSGMQVRLAFSIAIRADTEILLIDEVLAVGDAAFQKKCLDVFRELKKEGRTIILVTHDMGNVERFCDQVLVINKGKQLGVMTPAEAASLYARLNIDQKQVEQEDENKKTKIRYGNYEVQVQETHLTHNGKKTEVFNINKELTLTLDLHRKAQSRNLEVLYGLAIYNEDGVNVMGPNSLKTKLKSNAKKVSYTIDHIKFVPGEYAITIALYSSEDLTVLDFLDKWIHFSVISDHLIAGLVEADGEWGSE